MGRGYYKVRHHDRSGWFDLAGAGRYGAAKGLRYGRSFYHGRRIRHHPKGIHGGRARYRKRMRQREARRHRHSHRRYVRRADWLDRWYGYGTLAHSGYQYLRNRNRYRD